MKAKLILWSLVSLVLLSYGLYQGLMVAPTEATMGDVQRIFYYHVPSAWMFMLCFLLNCVASITYLVIRSPQADALALSSAEGGVVFCTVVLVTGPIWAKPIWGIWWTWDARLTSTLVVWLIYVSYLILRRFAFGSQGALLSAVLAVFGALDTVFVYMAIRWFRTQHPQPVIGGAEGSGLDPSMGHALLWNWLAFVVFGGLVMWLRYRLARLEQEVEEVQALEALTEGAPKVSR